MAQSSQSLPDEATDPVDRLITRLYRSVISVPADQYRSWALDCIKELIPHDYALWGTGIWKSRRFHTLTLNQLPQEYGAQLERTANINPILPAMLRKGWLERPTCMEDIVPDAEFYQSPVFRQTFAPYGIQRIMTTVLLDRRSGVGSVVTLYRKDRERPFTDQEREMQKRLCFHLMNASSHGFFVHVARSQKDRPSGTTTAVVDPMGQLQDAQSRFLDLLDRHFPDYRDDEDEDAGDPYGGSHLPFSVPDNGDTVTVGADKSLCARGERMGQLLLVHLWPAGPLDRLTLREREIVMAVVHGLSFKQAARKIGVAPSTVANHLYRIYRKLNVNSRTELADLIHVE